MPLVNEHDLEKFSSEVLSRHLREKTALTDGVVDVSQRENLNPEQIKRLVEAVNNATFLHKFNNPERTEDRMVDFETANPDAAIQRLLSLAGPEENKNEAPELDLPTETPTADLMNDLPRTRDGELGNALKQLLHGEGALGHGEEKESSHSEHGPRIRGTIVIMRLRKTAEDLKSQTYAKRFELTDTVQKLATEVSRLPREQFAEFEKDAFYLWGNDAVPHLNLLRGALRLPQADYNHGALTKVARIIDANTERMRRFQNMMKQSAEVTTLQKAEENIQQKIKELV